MSQTSVQQSRGSYHGADGKGGGLGARAHVVERDAAVARARQHQLPGGAAHAGDHGDHVLLALHHVQNKQPRLQRLDR